MYYGQYKWCGPYQIVFATNQKLKTFRSVALYIISYTVLRICTLLIQSTSTQFWDRIVYTCLVCCTVLFISFISPASSLLILESSLLFGLNLLYCRSPFALSFFILFSLQLFVIFRFSFRLLRHYLSVLIIFKSAYGNDFRKSAKDRGLKIKTDVIIINGTIADPGLSALQKYPARTWSTATNFNDISMVFV